MRFDRGPKVFHVDQQAPAGTSPQTLDQQAQKVLKKGSYSREELLREVRNSVADFMRRRASSPPFDPAAKS